MNLDLTWQDVVHLYECHSLSGGYYLKSRSDEIRLISCLPKSNKGLKDDYLVVSENSTMVFTAQLGQEHQVGYSRIRSLGRDLSLLSFPFTCF